MKILAIDPGSRNMAWVMTDGGAVTHAGRTDIFEGKPIESSKVFVRTMQFVADMMELIREADVVIVEQQFVDKKRQLSTTLITIQTTIQTAAFPKVRLISPMSVKRYFNMECQNNHQRNKQLSVLKAQELSPKFAATLEAGTKVDDICDAFLLNMYFCNRHL
mgnify:CR=1 FL=1